MITLVHGRVRQEEKLLLEASERLGIKLRPIHERELVLDLDGLVADVVLQRCISATNGLYVAQAADAAGTPCINSAATIQACMDKATTSWTLRAAGVPTPEIRVAFDPDAALTGCAQLGYPVVMKPTQGSWARLVAKAEHPEQAEQLIEHRAMLPNPMQHVSYIQAYVDKAHEGMHRDVRAFVIGDQTVAAIWRTSPGWVTNTARGATTQALIVDDSLNDLCQRAAAAVGGGALAVDLMETPDGFTVHEINHNMEFRNSVGVTGVDIPGLLLQHCVREAKR